MSNSFGSNSSTLKAVFLGALAVTGASVTALAGAPIGGANEPAVATRGVHTVVATGSFFGQSDHETRGTATIIQTEAGFELRFGADFYLDGAPAPTVGFGVDGEFVEASQISDLHRKRGAQFYRLPEGFTPTSFTEVTVWCEDFSVPLGTAVLDFTS